MYRRICKVAIVLLLGLATLETGAVDVGHTCTLPIFASDPGGSSGGTGGGRI